MDGSRIWLSGFYISLITERFRMSFSGLYFSFVIDRYRMRLGGFYVSFLVIRSRMRLSGSCFRFLVTIEWFPRHSCRLDTILGTVDGCLYNFSLAFGLQQRSPSRRLEDMWNVESPVVNMCTSCLTPRNSAVFLTQCVYVFLLYNKCRVFI